jgi:hypothetical protein
MILTSSALDQLLPPAAPASVLGAPSLAWLALGVLSLSLVMMGFGAAVDDIRRRGRVSG